MKILEPGYMALKALIFDCDGVLADTERDGHRVAFNQVFRRRRLGFEWGVSLYGELLETFGGKERLARYCEEHGWPTDAGPDRKAWVAEVHAEKSRVFQEMVRDGAVPLRPGINRLVDEAREAGLKLAVCSTAREESVLAVMDQMGSDRRNAFDTVCAGDVVERKKPDPAVYLLALERLDLEGSDCVVIEDTALGLQAALGAGMHCVVTTSAYTAQEDFSGALLVVDNLDEPPGKGITVDSLKTLCTQEQ